MQIKMTVISETIITILILIVYEAPPQTTLHRSHLLENNGTRGIGPNAKTQFHPNQLYLSFLCHFYSVFINQNGLLVNN
jgi:hypothetical protein